MKEVIVLGAGASKAVKASLQEELLQEIYIDYPKSEVSQFLKDVFGVKESLDKELFPTIEEILGIIEIDAVLSKNKNLKTFNPRTNENGILSMISKVLKSTISSYGGKSDNHPHENLTRRLIEQNKLSNTTFISLNYDIILESRIMEASNYKIDYGLNDSNNYFSESELVKVYKPHGSLNLGYCEKCKHYEIFDYKVLDEILRGKTCRDCASKLNPFMISPTYFKHYKDKNYIKILGSK